MQKKLIEEELNYNLYKEGYKSYEKDFEKIAKIVIKNTPRQMLIEILKKMKIIESDWIKGKNKYKPKELDKTKLKQ